MTKLYALMTASIILLARKVPVSLSGPVESLALSLVAASRHLPPMPRRELTLGVPFIGKGVCEDCFHSWVLFSPVGGDENIELECPECKLFTGVIA